MHKSLIRLCCIASLALLAACARSPVLSPEGERLPERVELSDVPFFPQQAYQCGPAALSTMLNQRGVMTSPGLLKDKVYIPGREGSLQVEMVAAARSHEMLVYPLQPRLDAVLAEVAAGNPVLVLQNLGFDWYPQWHFAVVVGYDRRERELMLRSGTTRRLETSFNTFDRTWARGGRWAVVTLSPDRLPAQADMHTWMKAASDLEQTGQAAAARRAYRTASEAWPKESLPWFALSNSRYADGDRKGAEQALRESLKREPGFAAGWFNLSQVLGEQGCAREAQQAQACAQRLAPKDSRFAAPPKASGSEGQCQALPACP
ncbi:PA2778 family cysteine peptidase [Pseudomonas sp. GOM7]|uniref:PA2778 family cysteine peptidase n=1 Tax=Pseudomonas sp. GOM7 TaxID=2998079 RepID=UPI00227BC5D2|nr:PA2778 family cysteine peptidase [Pseudomonas sp. GOM7]WAJ35853.1 PA2778 family cysteine peptidase [Pseudomonas sp. GOM7]